VKAAEVSSTVKRVSTALLGGALALAVTLLITGMMIAVTPRQAQATAQFAGQTGKPCGFCHQNAAGGGKLKPAGEKFKQGGNK
jgi:hypothetical protein